MQVLVFSAKENSFETSVKFEVVRIKDFPISRSREIFSPHSIKYCKAKLIYIQEIVFIFYKRK